MTKWKSQTRKMCLAGAWMTEKYFARHLMHAIINF